MITWITYKLIADRWNSTNSDFEAWGLFIAGPSMVLDLTLIGLLLYWTGIIK